MGWPRDKLFAWQIQLGRQGVLHGHMLFGWLLLVCVRVLLTFMAITRRNTPRELLLLLLLEGQATIERQIRLSTCIHFERDGSTNILWLRVSKARQRCIRDGQAHYEMMIQSSLNQRVVSIVCISLSANYCWSDKTNLSYFLPLADYIVFSLSLSFSSSAVLVPRGTVANWKLLLANITPSPLHLTYRHFGCFYNIFSFFLFSIRPIFDPESCVLYLLAFK